MEDYELTLFDRIEMIRETNKKYDLEKNAYVSFSGGKDSMVLSALIDMAIPNNSIPRVYIDTGIEYEEMRKFVIGLSETDKRIKIIKPKEPIVAVLKKRGYPFKSKEHSHKVSLSQNGSKAKSIVEYFHGDKFACPNVLKYQEKPFGLKISSDCCVYLKKKPAKRYERESGRNIAILGLRIGEGGERANHQGCAVYDQNGGLKKLKPLNPVSNEFEKWFIEKNEIRLCKLYYSPYSFNRTGCKGCPYALGLEAELAKLATYFPKERAQCEAIWKPVYDEYRRIGYRLSKCEQLELDFKEK